MGLFTVLKKLLFNTIDKEKGMVFVMVGLSSSEIIFYGGIIIMIAACVLAVICAVVFTFTGKQIKKRLEQEYGKPRI